MDLRYKQIGAPSNTTYTLKNKYTSALALAVDLAAALFMLQALTIKLVDKLIAWAVVKVATSGLERVSANTLSCLAQEEYFYAYTPLQSPDQPEVSKTFNGTVYTINEKGQKKVKYFSGYASTGFGTTELGINLGNSFFSSYNSVDRWERVN